MPARGGGVRGERAEGRGGARGVERQDLRQLWSTGLLATR